MEQISITRFTPEKIGYRDRGIMKWLGMMLSDHSEALKKEEIDDQLIEVKAKEKMDEEEIAGVLYQAFVTDSPVCIQANVIRNGNYYKDLECKISGYVDNRIYLFLKDGRATSCTLEEIRNVEMMNMLDWYRKRR
ncbi:hypothetical protein MKY30_18960 [Oceanobacillus sp. FSL W8-0428]|uniref:YolD-like family protein n=1 Tax=Oceanobacillus sojae TaxID=582851 RepID=A0A511ZNZ0_9BACI|nr:hypothetical protein [Oceanobacillus sojae]GEN89158.1 hypothetical protein OSO01_38970 [Oceanobacillus sojae]